METPTDTILAEEVIESVEVKELRELRKKVNHLEKVFVDIDILEQRILDKITKLYYLSIFSQVFEGFVTKPKIKKVVREVLEEEKRKKVYPDDLICGCKSSVHYGKTYREIKHRMDNEVPKYDFHAWEKRCGANWVKELN